ncbi:MAG: glycosyltransferase family 2 protein [Planctomycetota bacterium]|nr:glycosyltransferase family 2 protein [Planctomycetota bacterium]
MLLSIMIPTHNRKGVLLRSLERLARLRVPAEHTLEIVVVANACSDGTAAAIAEAAKGFPFPLRAAEEPNAGVAHARNRALKEAKGDILFVLDDDIAVEPEWLAEHLAVHAERGAEIVGGKIGLWFEEKQPPDWLVPALESVLSWKDLGNEVRAVTNPGDCISGNFSMKRKVPETVGAFHTGLGRKAGSMLGGEEIDFVERALHAGFKVFYSPKAVGLHWIPASFFEDAYLRRLSIDMGRTRVFMKKKLPLGSILRRLLVNPVRIFGHQVSECFAVVSGNRKSWMKHRIKRWKQQGGWLATWQYLRGRTSTQTRAPGTMPPQS